jgi:hypothetical protein
MAINAMAPITSPAVMAAMGDAPPQGMLIVVTVVVVLVMVVTGEYMGDIEMETLLTVWYVMEVLVFVS